jgi:hypothetical protein
MVWNLCPEDTLNPSRRPAESGDLEIEARAFFPISLFFHAVLDAKGMFIHVW